MTIYHWDALPDECIRGIVSPKPTPEGYALVTLSVSADLTIGGAILRILAGEQVSFLPTFEAATLHEQCGKAGGFLFARAKNRVIRNGHVVFQRWKVAIRPINDASCESDPFLHDPVGGYASAH
jgi:hypothetical protein